MEDRTKADDDARALLLGTAPDKADVIGMILETTQYMRTHDHPGVHLEAGAIYCQGVVVFTDRTMQ